MAKKSVVLRNQKRHKIVAKYAEKRRSLKAAATDMSLPEEERLEAMRAFHALPRNASPVRVVNRCRITGRPKGVYAKFGLSRTKLREAAMRGDIPGLVKSSW